MTPDEAVRLAQRAGHEVEPGVPAFADGPVFVVQRAGFPIDDQRLVVDAQTGRVWLELVGNDEGAEQGLRDAEARHAEVLAELADRPGRWDQWALREQRLRHEVAVWRQKLADERD